MASPVIMIALAFSRSTVDHTSSTSNLGVRTTVLPWNIMPSIPHWHAPCMSGGSMKDTIGEGIRGSLLGELGVGLDLVAGEGVDALARAP